MDQLATKDAGLPELTLRGLAIGTLITVLFTASNVYLGLKVGLTFSSSIPAAVISMAVLRLAQRSNILENNMVQTQASAAGTLSSIIFVVPGLVMTGHWHGFPYWQTAGICAVGGVLGVMYSIPLRRAMVVQSDLVYPEGVAAAEVLRVGDRSGRAAAGEPGLPDILLGGAVAAAFSLLSGGFKLLVLMRPMAEGMRTSLRAVRDIRGGHGQAIPRTERDIPIHWVAGFSLLLALPMALVFGAFLADAEAPPTGDLFWGLVACAVLFTFVFGFLIAAACGYMAGLVGSSASPISGIGIVAVTLVSLLLLAVLAPSGTLDTPAGGRLAIATALFTTAVIVAVASISNDNLQDLKTGHLVGATPWRQQVALVVGCMVGALVIPPILDLLYAAYGFPGALPRVGMDPAQALAAPQATLMSAIATGIFTHRLDWTMILIGVGLGIAAIAADAWMARRSATARLPVLAVGIGIYLPPTISVTIVIGAVLGWLIHRRLQRRAEAAGMGAEVAAERAGRRGVLLASGLIVGESLMGVLLAGIIGATGNQAPLSMVGADFEGTAGWLGLAAFLLVCAGFYGRVTARR